MSWHAWRDITIFVHWQTETPRAEIRHTAEVPEPAFNRSFVATPRIFDQLDAFRPSVEPFVPFGLVVTRKAFPPGNLNAFLTQKLVARNTIYPIRKALWDTRHGNNKHGNTMPQHTHVSVHCSCGLDVIVMSGSFQNAFRLSQDPQNAQTVLQNSPNFSRIFQNFPDFFQTSVLIVLRPNGVWKKSGKIWKFLENYGTLPDRLEGFGDPLFVVPTRI